MVGCLPSTKHTQIFVDATARVEGNGPTGCIVLADYKRVIGQLQEQRVATVFPSIKSSIDVMIKWMSKYQTEALKNKSIRIATILNPRYRGRFFEIHYPQHHDVSLANLRAEFASRTEQTETAAKTQSDADPKESPDIFDVFGPAEGVPGAGSPDEVDEYLSGCLPMGKDDTPLGWWKVIFFTHFFILKIN